MSRKNSPFAKAKVGDWIIDDDGRCYQIASIEDGEYGGVRIHRHLRFFWDGHHTHHSGLVTTARMATAEEIAEWQAEQARKAEERRLRDEAEERAERIRDAAPALLEACKILLPLAEDYLRSAPTHPDNAKLETARAAIAAAEPR